MAEIASAFVTILPSFKGGGSAISRELDPALDGAGKSGGKKLGGGILGAAKSFVGPLAAMFAVGAGVAFFKGAVDGASSLSESASKVGVVFGDQADQILKASETSAKAMGLSKSAYLDATGGLGNLLVSLKIAPKAAADMSQQMVTLAGDLASFNNVAPEEALAALQSGLTGETEPLKKFGINMNDATLKAEAMKLGLIASTKDAMDPQTKALAAQSLIMSQTGTAQGDFARTSDGLANQQRIAAAATEDLKTKIGAGLLPAVTFVTSAYANFVTGMTDGTGAGGKFRDVLTLITEGFTAYVLPVLQQAGTFIMGTLVPAFVQFAGYVQANVVPVIQTMGTFFTTSILPAIMSIAGFITGTLVPAFMSFYATVVANVVPIIQSLWTAFTVNILPALMSVYGVIADQVVPALISLGKFLVPIIGFVYEWAVKIAGFLIPILVNFIGPILGGLIRVLGTVIGWIASAIVGVFSFAGAIGRGAVAVWDFAGDVGEAISEAIDWVVGLPGRVTGALGNLGTLLLNAGKDILKGFLDGLTEGFENVKDFVGGIGSWIADHKGPKAYDLKLLTPAGGWIMTGLRAGIEDEIPALEATLNKVTGAIKLPHVNPGMSGVSNMGAGVSADSRGGITNNIYEAVSARATAMQVNRFQSSLAA